MAQQSAIPQVLQWGRNVDGRFLITVSVQVSDGAGRQMIVPIHTFALTPEEEDKLRAALGGIAIARDMPKTLELAKGGA